MTLRRSSVGDIQVLMVSGDIDLTSLPRFTDALVRLVADAPGAGVVVDVDGTGIVDDAALGLLLGAAGRARAAGGDLSVVSTESRLRSRLAETGFDRAVTVTRSIAGK